LCLRAYFLEPRLFSLWDLTGFLVYSAELSLLGTLNSLGPRTVSIPR
jgi:hypothetical protein